MLEFLIFPLQLRLESRLVRADLQSFQTLLATFSLFVYDSMNEILHKTINTAKIYIFNSRTKYSLMILTRFCDRLYSLLFNAAR